MAGRKLSRTNQGHIDTAIARLMAAGGRAPGPDTTPIKADSLGDQIEAVTRAVYAMGGMEGGYCCVEDVYADYVVIEVCERGIETYWRADYSMDASGAVTLAGRDAWVQVEEVWQPVSATAKAGAIVAEAERPHYATLKAVGDRRIEVLVSYYGHKDGKDSHNEFFSPRTDFAAEDFPTPPLLYYHGFDESNRKMGKPVVTGKFESRRDTPNGHALTYKLKSGKYADEQWESSLKGECVVSPGTVGHLIRKAPDGELTYWPLAEVSAWKFDAKRPPANLHSVAAPVLKALYLSEGLTIPETLSAPETAGDAVASDADTSLTPDEQARLVAQVVADQLRTYRKELTQL